MTETDRDPLEREHLQAVETYLDAFEKRDVGRCVDLFAEDAELHFGPVTLGLGRFRGRDAIEKWHRERFEAGARVVEVDGIDARGDEVRARILISSPRLKAVRVPDLRGSAAFLFSGSKIKQLKLGLARGYRFHV
jgi:hypothetical protein